jgi:hypothetical protein
MIHVNGVSAVADEKGWRDLVKELAGAVSTQAEVANRMWLGLITVALFALIPHVPTNGTVALPFSLGDVSPVWFHGIVFSILVVLAVSFASAHTQQVRAQKLAHKVIDSLVNGTAANDLIHPREYFDMWRMPSLNRVASLPQALRGKYQFFVTSERLPTWLRLVTVTYYGLLKLVSWAVYFLLPIWALWHALANVSPSGPLRWYAAIGAFVAGGALLQVLLLDLAYAITILRHLWHVKSPKETNRIGVSPSGATKKNI